MFESFILPSAAWYITIYSLQLSIPQTQALEIFSLSMMIVKFV